MLQSGIVELDLHGLNRYQAKVKIDSSLRRCRAGTYRLRLIHGYHGGSAISTMIRKRYASHEKVLRVELSLNPGVTELVLREF